MMNNGNKQNHWKYLSIGLLAVLAVSLVIPRADAASDISQLTQQILNIVKNATYGNQAIKNAIAALQTSINGIDTSLGDTATQESVDALQSYAITVTASQPTEDVNILELEEGIMYKGHVSGIMSISAVEDNSIGLFCALHGNNAPLLTMATLVNDDTPEFQSVAIEANFTCTSMRMGSGAVSTGALANLAIDYSVIEGIEEIETSP